MTQDGYGNGRSRRRLRWLRFCGRGLVELFRLALRLGLVVVFLVAIAVYAGLNGPVTLPSIVSERVERELSRRLGRDLSAEIETLALDLRSGGRPVVVARQVRLLDAEDRALLRVDKLDAVLSRDDALAGRLRPTALLVDGVDIQLRRDAERRLTVAAGDRPVLEGIAGPTAAARAVRATLGAPALSELSAVGVEDVSIRFDDTLEGRQMTSDGGSLRFERADDRLRLDADLGRVRGAAIGPGGGSGDLPGRVSADFVSDGPGAPLRIELSLLGIRPAALAGVPGAGPLSDLLGRLDAPVTLRLSGAFATGDGTVPERLALDGHLAVGAGALNLPGLPEPQKIDHLRAELALSPDGRHLAVRGLDLAAPELSLAGRVDLWRAAADGIAMQLALDHLTLDPTQFAPRRTVAGETDGPLVPASVRGPDIARSAPPPERLNLDGLWADLRYDANSGQVELATMTMRQGPAEVVASGRLTPATEEGQDPSLSLDLGAAPLDVEQVLELWPATILTPTRDWLGENLRDGRLTQISGALRKPSGGLPDIALSFGFEGATVRPAPGFPLVRNARGTGTVEDNGFALWVASAETQAPEGGQLQLRDGHLTISDLSRRPNIMEVAFAAEGSVTAAVSVGLIPAERKTNPALLPPPNAERRLDPQDLRGTASAQVWLRVPFARPGLPAPIGFEVDATARDVSSAALVPGAEVAADRLDVRLSNSEIEVSGGARVGGAPLDFVFRRPLGGGPAPGNLRADGPLTPELLRGLGLAIPEAVALTGAGRLEADITLPPGEPPRVVANGDLRGLGVAVPRAGIDKPESADGSVAIAGTFGQSGAIERISLDLPGATLRAGAQLAEGGGLALLELETLRLGRWLQARARYDRGADGGPRLTILSGEVDLTRKPPTETARQVGLPDLSGTLDRVAVSLDRLTVAPGLALTGLRGTLSARLTGRLHARINGAADLAIDVSSAGTRPTIRLSSANAGGVASALGAGLDLHGGSLDLRLQPASDPGTWKGEMRARNLSLQQAPGAAQLLAALNLGSAMAQASGGGIALDDIRGDFRLRPGRIDLRSASAVGPAIGLRLEGSVDLAGSRLDLRGSASPLGGLNRPGVTPGRRGEGMLGVGFSLRGPPDRPRVDIRAMPAARTAPSLRDPF